jgi:hypothetical protein
VVGLPELFEATRFFPAGEEPVEKQHPHVCDEDKYAGPDEKGAESKNRQAEVLRVASEPE